MTSNPNDIKGEVILFAKVYPKAGTGPQILDWMGKLRAAVANEPGTLEYSWAQNGDELLIWERYVDAAAFQTHMEGDTFKAYIAADLLKVVRSYDLFAVTTEADAVYIHVATVINVLFRRR
ncbi:uncharacterized protein STEHIDRAFT_114887 [Stereum hirsutum FP-91666 SS1]|uniref:uncharacterized protein n=1 Tax=Stereum hirsutum (strain FP-91666) TaxID=721885 RepID=UPI000444993A|nr:uncharacterized protein STEHIDRAFT_114887 [Stereum hirsutum FP-91666 SS1]EIM81438.1 hypothetical protein STEHIDRAFT_114887 [Stereum hirsutum FP-91666 SS1]